ncbi:DNA recombination protein RmuC [Lichenicoccus roseus]|uniref:DNA recombination protein RmuC homolog n=1 Tax=Lichenicoccus roseus TaxID=2683649 RepID=A0A5R9JG22_9PROT|nr:DNA recombination protein RmuC [Lichenicoccus roseus]TLU73228.1 DNA recombination protein RmuC [Lichenicoccus roseus]
MSVAVLLASLALLVAVATLVVGFLVLRALHDPAPREEADMLHRLGVLAEREQAARVADAERTAIRLGEIERILVGRIEQNRNDVSERLGTLTTMMAREQGEARVAMANGLREMSEQSARRLAAIQSSVNEQLHAAVEKQMQTSFQRVLEQFGAVQKAMGEVAAMTAQIGDLKRLFSNVKTRGGWGEAQLRAILDDVLPTGAYESNCKLSAGSSEVVEFAVRMPMRGGGPGAVRPLLAIDSKFPTEAYERLLQAVEQVDADGERTARRALEQMVRLEARKIASKYIVPPITVEFAVLYLPTDGLYAEIARVPGLIDEIGRTQRVMIMGPSLIPALLRTIHLGYVTLALEEKTEIISQLLGATRQEMVKMDGVLEKLGRNASAMSSSIEEARRRTRVVARKLRGIEAPDAAEAASLLDLPFDALEADAVAGAGSEP